jgi:hypothetical protein
MSRAHLVLSSLVVASLWAVPGCATHRCTEFQVEALAVAAELGVEQIGGTASLERQPGLPLSEEAAIYAKRLKTLCELLWEDRITYTAYRSAAREAYRGYQTSRGLSAHHGSVGRSHTWPARPEPATLPLD